MERLLVERRGQLGEQRIARMEAVRCERTWRRYRVWWAPGVLRAPCLGENFVKAG